LAKYPFISEKKANNEVPLKSPFEAVNYYISLRPSRAKTNPSVVFKHSNLLLQSLKSFKNDLVKTALLFVFQII